jgi:hypothetical protein
MGTPIQRTILAVFAGLTAVVGILRFFNPHDLLINSLQEFVLGALVGAIAILVDGLKKRT